MKNTMYLIVCTAVILACAVCIVPSITRGEEFGGIGAVVAQLYDVDSPQNLGAIVVLSAPQGSEASKSGIQAGDVILEIDGKKTSGRQFGDIVLNSLRGVVGSYSDFKIQRMPGNKTLMIRIKRALISYTPENEK